MNLWSQVHLMDKCRQEMGLAFLFRQRLLLLRCTDLCDRWELLQRGEKQWLYWYKLRSFDYKIESKLWVVQVSGGNPQLHRAWFHYRSPPMRSWGQQSNLPCANRLMRILGIDLKFFSANCIGRRSSQDRWIPTIRIVPRRNIHLKHYSLYHPMLDQWAVISHEPTFQLHLHRLPKDW